MLVMYIFTKKARQDGLALPALAISSSISGLVVEYIVAIDVTQARFPADAFLVRLIPSLSRRVVLLASMCFELAPHGGV